MKLLFPAALLGLLLLAEAQLIHANDFVERRFVNAHGENMRYLLFVPKEYDKQKKYRMIEAIKRAGGKPRYTEYKGVGHNAWERAFAEPDFLSWIFSQSAAIVDTTRPSGRAGHCLLYDEHLQMILLLNGYQPPYQPEKSEIWGWNGERWKLLAKDGPVARSLSGAAYDSRRGRVVEFGGVGNKGYSELKGDMWEWDGRAWHLMPDTSVGTRDHHAMAYDQSRGVTVMYGGQNSARQFDTNTWEWNGSAWKKIVTFGPGNRAHHAMAYDAKRKRVVLFGGFGEGDDLGDTWEWDGMSWQQIATSGPPPRARHRLAFDAKLGKIILFGGTGVKTTHGSGFNFLGDTWLWDGRSWIEAKVSGPPARSMHAMAYDAHRQKIVLFGGGNGGNDRLNDTWEWDGQAWRKAQ